MTRRQVRRRNSLSEAVSISLGLNTRDLALNRNDKDDMSGWNTKYSGASIAKKMSESPSRHTGYNSTLSAGFRNRNMSLPTTRHAFSQSIHGPSTIYRQTGELSNEFEYSQIEEQNIPDYIAIANYEDQESAREQNAEEVNDVISQVEDCDEALQDYARPLLTPIPSSFTIEEDPGRLNVDYNSISSSYYNQSDNASLGSLLTQIINYLPAAILGLLLNILDALSYGMIIFPITEPTFASMGPTGISMFYISTIICQLVISTGASGFPTGIGSEMIEITPFYHAMAFSIKNSLQNHDDVTIISTTIFCYMISSIITGGTFLLLGKLKLGKIVGFFPRHILVGCIGGVGYFLIITGIEVTTRVAEFEYSWQFLASLFDNYEILAKWMLPVTLTVILIWLQKCFNNSLVLPSFYIIALILFHFIVALLPNLSLNQLRKSEWIFPVSSSDDSWYDHYKYFNVTNVHWSLVWNQIPTMLALTFFGILHVPINVPALAMSLHVDKYDVDRELIVHGYSNLFSGLLGSVQNYLVYTNSVLFIRAGADSRIASYLLVVLTFIIMAVGPVIVSFIPVAIVGSLIFLLGYELIMEALYDTLTKVTLFEYITILIIVLTMGIIDFVAGIIVGILIACFSFLIDSTKLQTVQAEFDGHVAKSTVYRDYIQTKFLNGIREQIYTLKLQSVLFFGTIISIEEKIDKLLELSDKDSSIRRIKYLILDFKNINSDNIDYSAAEGFNRIKRFTQSKNIQLIISSIKETDRIYNVFNNVGLLENVELFEDLNTALEWCENELLLQYRNIYRKIKEKLPRKAGIMVQSDAGSLIESSNNKLSVKPSMPMLTNTPRNHQLLSVARNLLKNEELTVKKYKESYKIDTPIIPLLLFVLKQYRPAVFVEDETTRNKEIEFWSQLGPYFTKQELSAGSAIVHGNNIFFIVERGVLKVSFELPQGTIYETLSNRTCYGKINSPKTSSMVGSQIINIHTQTNCILWVINSATLSKIKSENLDLYTELLLLIMDLKEDRFKNLLGYSLVSA